ncbi:MAG: hemolysin III family protein [Anaerolineae bacterium]|nr:hemolysin III family protein [Anaerolineae bacterium]
MSTTQRRINEFYTRGEEIANASTHGLGVVLAAVGLVTLTVMAARYGSTWHVVSFTVYGSTLLLLFLASTLYHTIQQPRVRHWMRVCDHSAIYLFIAGTYTPFLLVTMRNTTGLVLLIVVWTLAFLGIAFKTLFIGRFHKLETAGYVAMGWLCVLAFRQMVVNLPPGGLYWLFAGGIVYTVGVIFFMWESLPYNHAIWHLFVLVGSVCHFCAIAFHVLPA